MVSHCYSEMDNQPQLVKDATLARLETDVLLHVTKKVLRKDNSLTFKCPANHANCVGCYKLIETRMHAKFTPAA